MTRLVVFTLFLVGLAAVMNFGNYNKLEVDNSRFDMKKAEEAHIALMKEKEALEKQYAEAIAPKVVSDEVEIVVKPLVELTTPQLERGHALYKQCIACHAKDGAGKAANKAPRIGGQMAWYIEKQLTDMKNEIRVNKNMATIVKKLSMEDIKDLAVYTAKLPWGPVEE